MTHRRDPCVTMSADDHVPLGVGGSQSHSDRHALWCAKGEVHISDAIFAGRDLVAWLAGDLATVSPPPLKQIHYFFVGGGAGHVQTQRRGGSQRHILARDRGGAGNRDALRATQIIVGHRGHRFR